MDHSWRVETVDSPRGTGRLDSYDSSEFLLRPVRVGATKWGASEGWEEGMLGSRSPQICSRPAWLPQFPASDGGRPVDAVSIGQDCGAPGSRRGRMVDSRPGRAGDGVHRGVDGRPSGAWAAPPGQVTPSGGPTWPAEWIHPRPWCFYDSGAGSFPDTGWMERAQRNKGS